MLPQLLACTFLEPAATIPSGKKDLYLLMSNSSRSYPFLPNVCINLYLYAFSSFFFPNAFCSFYGSRYPVQKLFLHGGGISPFNEMTTL